MTNRERASELDIDRAVVIESGLDAVFSLYTQRAASWWPFVGASHSGANAIDLTYEPRVGGRVYETLRDGGEVTWGHIVRWDPPRNFVYSYRPFADERLTEVELSFTPLAPERTEVRVQHRGWEAHGQAGVQRSAGYSNGWKRSLALFAEAAGRTAATTGQDEAGGASREGDTR